MEHEIKLPDEVLKLWQETIDVLWDLTVILGQIFGSKVTPTERNRDGSIEARKELGGGENENQ